MAPEPRVVHVSQKIPGAVYVGRSEAYGPIGFGNPFRIRRDTADERALCLVKYAVFLMMNPALVARARRELAGKDLACHCAPKACHADVLIIVANSPEPKP